MNHTLVKDSWCWWDRKYAPEDTVLEGLVQAHERHSAACGLLQSQNHRRGRGEGKGKTDCRAQQIVLKPTHLDQLDTPARTA